MFEIHQAKFPVIINHEITVLPKKINVNKVEVKVCKWLLASGAYWIFSCIVKGPYLK